MFVIEQIKDQKIHEKFGGLSLKIIKLCFTKHNSFEFQVHYDFSIY